MTVLFRKFFVKNQSDNFDWNATLWTPMTNWTSLTKHSIRLIEISFVYLFMCVFVEVVWEQQCMGISCVSMSIRSHMLVCVHTTSSWRLRECQIELRMCVGVSLLVLYVHLHFTNGEYALLSFNSPLLLHILHHYNDRCTEPLSDHQVRQHSS